jgi:hypothetical protein
MTERFKDYVTSTAFNLTLSKPMIDCLSQLHGRGSSWASLHTANALENRGLVERVDAEKGSAGFTYMKLQLTDAGRAVIPLLDIAGLLIPYEKLPDFADANMPPPCVKLKTGGCAIPQGDK